MMKRLLVFATICLCMSCKKDKELAPLSNQYIEEFEQYKIKTATNRIKYLELCGLHKIKTGIHKFGKDSTNAFVVDAEASADFIGAFQNENDNVLFVAQEGVDIRASNDSIISKISMERDSLGNSFRLYHNGLSWQIITRDNAPYLRVWDSKNPFVTQFKGYEHFELDPQFIFNAEFNYFDTEKTEEVSSQLGVNASTKFIGRLTFEYQGTTYNLDVGRNGFTMVSDLTTGEESYGGGRYVYVDLPKENGAVVLDFNRLYNPPCSFSKYTTCLYPPRQNNLPFKIEAGETNSRL